MRGDVLGDLRRVDVDVDELRVRGELRQLAGDAIVEARADAADEVGLVHRVVRGARAVHAEHAQPLRVRRGERAEAHQRARDREAVGGRELDELLGGVRVDDAAAGVDDRAPRGRHRLRRLADLLGVAVRRRLIAGQVDVADRLVVDVRAREVLRDVDDDRTGPPRAREVERLVDRARDLLRRTDLEGVLDDRHRDAERVGLLEAVGADEVGAHLTGDEHRRHGVHHRVDDRRDDVRRAGAGGGERDADLAGRLRVALGSVSAAGLVAHEDVADAAVDERVVGGKVGAPGEAEYDVHTLRLQALHDGIDRTHVTTSSQQNEAGPSGRQEQVSLVAAARTRAPQRRTGAAVSEASACRGTRARSRSARRARRRACRRGRSSGTGGAARHARSDSRPPRAARTPGPPRRSGTRARTSCP